MSVRELIREKLFLKQLTMKEASMAMGRNHAYLQQYLERGIPVRLPEDAREALAPLLGVKPGDLREHIEDALKEKIRGLLPSGVNDNAPARANMAPRRVPLGRLPVLGSAEGGADGQSPWNGDVVDYVPMPAGLAGVPQAYAIYVYGTSMEPRYFAGDIAYVHPGRPVGPGAFVLVQLKPRTEGDPPSALIKRLVRQTATKLVLEQFNPARTFDVKQGDVVRIHRIVGSGES
jgi:SOS-response transcriptional repressor LexA